MGALFLTEDDVRRLVDMRTAIDVLDEAFRRLAADDAANVPRFRAAAPGMTLHAMSASAAYLGVSGWKAYSTAKSGARFHVGLYDHATGKLTALMEANHLGRLRTGAATGVAAQYMAAPETTEAGLFGTGFQAETQLVALATVCPLKQVFVYGRRDAQREEFAERMSLQLGIDVTPVDRPIEAAEDLPLVVTATTSREPVFDGHWLAEGALVCAVGSNWLNKAEIDDLTVQRCEIVVCDSVEACQREAGDFAAALEKGSFDWARAVDLSRVVSGKAAGRSRNSGLRLFKSVGLAIEDVALGAEVLKRAKDRGLGQELPF